MTTVQELTSQKCSFCNYALHRKRQHIVAETERFYCMPSIGQISNGGHLLIVPRKHFTCLGAMDDATFSEFEDFSAQMKKAVTDVYGKPISFEHGIIGQSIPHAHLQMLPIAADLDALITEEFKTRITLSSMRELQEIYAHRGVYLFSENTRDEKLAYVVDHFPQYLRIVAAKAAGTPERGDWKIWRADAAHATLDDCLMTDTVTKLKQALQ